MDLLGHDLFPNNFIDQTAIIGDEVTMGTGNVVGPYTVIYSGVTLGNNNRFQGQCSIGSPAEHKKYFSESPYGVLIGDGNTFREFVTVNDGTERPTVIGNNCIMLRGAHHSHDSVMEDDVTLSCNVLVGGHSHIMKGANIGLGAILHQYQVIGAYAMIGMGTILTKKSIVYPGCKYVGNPARHIGLNEIGLERAGVKPEDMLELNKRFAHLKGLDIL